MIYNSMEFNKSKYENILFSKPIKELQAQYSATSSQEVDAVARSTDFAIRNIKNAYDTRPVQAIKIDDKAFDNLNNSTSKLKSTKSRRSELYNSGSNNVKIAAMISGSKERYGDPHNIIIKLKTKRAKKKSLLRRPLNDSTFISSSYREAVGLNSTFEDEDEIFNVILKSKLSHVRQKQKSPIEPRISTSRNILKSQKNMKTITDKESEIEEPQEETKLENHNFIEEQSESQPLKLVNPCQDLIKHLKNH
mmetsp:Transcript_29983/g.26553  ORF Transcript_29983/g.26553 Transcript_29983/m.26553 type:complete len:250 (+) Transcript_29983:196-945(+)